MDKNAHPTPEEPFSSAPALLVGAWVALAFSAFVLLLCFSTFR